MSVTGGGGGIPVLFNQRIHTVLTDSLSLVGVKTLRPSNTSRGFLRIEETTEAVLPTSSSRLLTVGPRPKRLGDITSDIDQAGRKELPFKND